MRDVDHLQRRIVLAEHRVRLRPQLVALPAQAGDQCERIAEADLVLPEQAQLATAAGREITHREAFAEDHVAADAGRQVGLAPIALAEVAVPRQFDPEHVPVLHPAALLARLAEEFQAAVILLQLEAAFAQRLEAGRAIGQPHLRGVLAGAVALCVHQQLGALQPRPVRLPFALHAEAIAPIRIVAQQRGGGGVASRPEAQRTHVGLNLSAAMVEGGGPAVGARPLEHQLRQQRRTREVGRVRRQRGRGIVGLVGIAAGRLQQALQRAGRCGERSRQHPAMVAPGPADAAAGIAIGIDAVQQVLRIAGAHGDDAGQRIAAVQRGGRATQDLDPLHGIDVEQVAPGGSELADAECIRDRHPVDLHADPVAIQPADRETLPAKAVAIAERIHPGLVAHQVGNRLHLATLHGRAVDFADRAHQLPRRLGDLAGHHHHPVQGALHPLHVGVIGLHRRRHRQQAG